MVGKLSEEFLTKKGYKVKNMEKVNYKYIAEIMLNQHNAIREKRTIKHIYDNVAMVDGFYFFINKLETKEEVEEMSDKIFNIDRILNNRFTKTDIENDEDLKELIADHNNLKDTVWINPEADIEENQINLLDIL